MGLKIDNGVLLSPDANGNYIERAAFSADGDLVFKNPDGSSKGAGITQASGDGRYLQLVGGSVTGALHANHTSNTFTASSVTVSKGSNAHAYFYVSRTNYEAGIQFQTSGTTKWWLYMPTGNDNLIAFYHSGSNRFTVDSSGHAQASGNLYASGGNSTQWNTAYGWGNHASAGYLKINTSSAQVQTAQTILQAHSNAWAGGLKLVSQDGTKGFQIHPDNNGLLYVDGTWYFTGNVTTAAASRVGIGTTSPAAVLDVRYYDSALNIYRATDSAGQYRWRVDQNFSMFMTNSSGSDTISINNNGSASYTGGVTASDYYINNASTKLTEGNGDSLRIQTGTGYVDIGSMNSSWVHFQADRSVYMWAGGGNFAFDAHVLPYGNNVNTLGASSSRWSTIYGTNGDFSGALYVGTTNVDPSGVSGFAAGNIFEGTTGFSAPGIAIGSTTGQHGAIVYGSNQMYFGTENGSDNTLNTRMTLNSSGTLNVTGNITIGGANVATQAWASSQFAASAHTHDDRYYTETESDARFWRAAQSINVTTTADGSNSDPFDNAHVETRVTGNGGYSIAYTGASAHLISSNVGGSASIFQIGAHYNGSNFYMRTRTDSTSWQTWKRLWSSADFSQTNVNNWNTAYGWGNHASAGYLTNASIGNYATQQDITNAINNLIDSSPGTLDTLNELAAAINDDPNFYQTVNNKLSLSGGTLSGGLNMGNNDITGVNNIVINDPGPSEGIAWAGGNGWAIYESPDDLVTNSAGNFQFVRGATRVMTLDTSNHMNVAGYVKAYAIQGNANVSGTGAASYHPSGVYSTSYNWLYGGGSFNGGDWSNMGNLRTVDSSDGFWARYTAGSDNYAATLFWNTIQLGNNGQNILYVGKTNTGGYLDIYTNVTGDRSTTGANHAMRIQSNGRVSIGTTSDWGYTLSVSGGIYSDTWVRTTGSTGIYFESYGGGFRMTDTTWVRVYNNKALLAEDTIQSNSSLRAPIFYDSADTTYYLDPNASLSLKVSGNIDLIARSASWAEGIRIRVPSTSTWGGIRFTRDRANNDGNWAIGYTAINSSDDLTFWAENNGDGGSMKLQMDKAGNATFQTSVRAPIFYDSNDTNYYLDPASNSKLNNVSLYRLNDYDGTFLFRVGVTSGTTRHINLADTTIDPAGNTGGSGITWGQRTDNNPYYMIHTRYYANGYSTHNRLVLGWNTGIEIGASPSYGGTRFFDGAPGVGANAIMSIGAGDSHVRVVNNLYVGGGYIEPAGTNSMNLRRVNYITFAPDNSWNGPTVHGIMSTDINTNVADSISINSYNDITLRLDANNNNTESYLRITNNTEGNGTITYFGYDGSNIVAWFGGNVTVAGRITETSSIRYKTNVQDLGPTLSKVEQLRGVTYTKDGNDQTEIGMIAEEVGKLFPELVSTNEDGLVEALNYSRVTAVLVEAVKELSAKVQAQEIFIDNIVSRLERLENK